jgi:aspartyl-tRNA(Asn)/glutamyl-tRNA(Gln) amidotransferase subunit B
MSETMTEPIAANTDFEAVIGLELHAQLLTKSKMFCGCSATYVEKGPNENTCPVCLGLPGVLPVINRQAVELTIKTALALNCEIPEHSKFDRKNYFYPDLPKGYQISQYDEPLSRKGWLEFEVGDRKLTCGITRVHLEEDTGTLKHAGDVLQQAGTSFVDLNRAGVPLMEIVGEPHLRSAEEARAYVMKLRQILTFIGVNDGNLEEGSLRCDANVSVRRHGVSEYGVKVEIKNMNSFRAIHHAIEYEIGRQIDVVTTGGTIEQETRGWVEAKGKTLSQRSKEQAHDYRYFPEPDLPPLEISRHLVEQLRSALPELPDARAERLQREDGLSEYEAGLVVQTREWANFYDEVKTSAPAAMTKLVAHWLAGDVARVANATGTMPWDSKLGVEGIGKLLRLITEGKVSAPTAKALLDELYVSGGDPEQLVLERGLGQIGDESELGTIVDAVIAANGKMVGDFRSGKEAALQALVGMVMKETKGRADARKVTELLKGKLGAS